MQINYNIDEFSNLIITVNDKEYRLRLNSDFVNHKIEFENPELENQMFFLQPLRDEFICMYSDNRSIYIIKAPTKEAIYRQLIKLKQKYLFGIKIFHRVFFLFIAYFTNPYKIQINTTYFKIGEYNYSPMKIASESSIISKLKMLMFHLKIINIDLKYLADKCTHINNALRIAYQIDNTEITCDFRKPSNYKSQRLYFVPVYSYRNKKWATHIRRRKKGAFTFVTRPTEVCEATIKFKFFECRPISFSLFIIGKLLRIILPKPINIFYEKFSYRAEEGTFELFQKSLDSKNSYSFFIISKKSPDYPKVKYHKNIIVQYSFLHYLLVYSCSHFISTEAPSHTNVLRSNNKYYRRNLVQQKFIFLQHGITYLKSQTKNSIFTKGKDGEPTYIIVGSEKEKRVVTDMLKLSPEQVLNTGHIFFDNIEYNHINIESTDQVTIMLTWKPYDEHLLDYSQSSYVKDIISITTLVNKYTDKILIVPHPKVNELAIPKDIEKFFWPNKISDALENTKLLITDYSSVCYNAFYQGAGILFYHEDIERYELENGDLIPENNEYIGYRCFNIHELETHIKNGIKKGSIDLSYFRSNNFVTNFKSIYEYTDHNSTTRILAMLKKLNIV